MGNLVSGGGGFLRNADSRSQINKELVTQTGENETHSGLASNWGVSLFLPLRLTGEPSLYKKQ